MSKEPRDPTDRTGEQGRGRRRGRQKIRPSGGYRQTASFPTATIIYDATWWFCEKFLDSRSRLVDQMVQFDQPGELPPRPADWAPKRIFSRLGTLAAVEEQFVEGGGYSERLAALRLAERERRRNQTDPPDRVPACPRCGKPVVLRTAKSGKNTGQQFSGCSGYPRCKGVAPA